MPSYEANQAYRFNSLASDTVRHVIPAADIVHDDNGKAVMIFTDGVPFSLSSQKYGDPDFLRELSSCQPLKLEPVINNWQYHQKALAQEILPFLMLGPMAVARDLRFIQTNQITMLVAARDGRAAAINPKIMNPALFASAQGIETLTFDVFDEPDLIRRFPMVIKQMNEHLVARTRSRPVARLEDVGGRILVFCEAGDRRSAALVILFMMVVFGLPALSAIQAVQARRYGINIAGELHRVLQNYEEVLCAERQVAQSLTTRTSHAQKPEAVSRKRNIDEAEAEDDVMEGVQEFYSMGRAGMAPFKDTGS